MFNNNIKILLDNTQQIRIILKFTVTPSMRVVDYILGT